MSKTKGPVNLGYIEYPNAEVDSFNSRNGEVIIKLTNHKRVIKIRMSVDCVRTLHRLTKDTLNRYRESIVCQWAHFRHLNQETKAGLPE